MYFTHILQQSARKPCFLLMKGLLCVLDVTGRAFAHLCHDRECICLSLQTVVRLVQHQTELCHLVQLCIKKAASYHTALMQNTDNIHTVAQWYLCCLSNTQ